MDLENVMGTQKHNNNPGKKFIKLSADITNLFDEEE